MTSRKPIITDIDHIIPSIWDLRDGIEAYQHEQKTPTITGLVLSLGLRNEEDLLSLRERGDDYAFVVDRAIAKIKAFHLHKGLTKARNPQPHWQYLKAEHGLDTGMGGEAKEIRIIIDKPPTNSPDKNANSQLHNDPTKPVTKLRKKAEIVRQEPK